MPEPTPVTNTGAFAMPPSQVFSDWNGTTAPASPTTFDMTSSGSTRVSTPFAFA